MLKHKVKGSTHNHTHSHRKHAILKSSSIGVISLLIIFGSLFFITRGSTPYSSELAYIEYSTGGTGSVIPASCDSGNPHDAEVCGTWTDTGCTSACGYAAYNNTWACVGGNAGCTGAAPTGYCPATAPCCVANTGAGCGYNSCGDQGGTIQCGGSCSASAPERAGWNTACNPANVCGRTNSGAIQCDGSCSVSAPSNNTCIPTNVTISSTPSIGGGKSSTVTWSSANGAAGCEIRKRTFINAGDSGGDVAVITSSGGANGSLVDGPLPVPATVQGQSVLLGRGYYVAYKARCWDSSGTMSSDYSAEAVTRVGSARLWFTR